jgi:hypothetical protein
MAESTAFSSKKKGGSGFKAIKEAPLSILLPLTTNVIFLSRRDGNPHMYLLPG